MKAFSFLASVLFFITAARCQESEEIINLKRILSSKKDTARVNTLAEIGAAYLLKSQLDSGALYTGVALQEAKTLGYKKGEADAYNSTGNINLIQGKHAVAMEFYLKSLAIREELGIKKEIIPSYLNISTVHLRQKDFDKGLVYLKKALALAVEVKDSVRLAGIQNNYATILANTGGSLDSVLFYLNKCVLISGLIENNKDIDSKQLNHYKKNALLGIAQVLSRKGEGKSVVRMLDSLWQNETLASGLPNKLRVLRIIAENHFNNSDYKKAIEYANYAISLDSGYNNPVLMIDVYSILSDSYSGLGDYTNAYNAMLPYAKLKDSLYSREKLSVTNEMQGKYETEKRDLQIASLTKQKKSQRLIIILAVAGAIIAFSMLMVMYRSKKLQHKLFAQKEDLLRKEKEIEEGRLKTKMTELEQMALRAQMNPHFIFNSLNSVQHFVLNKDVEGVNKYLGAFAHLIRQTLNNSGKQVISLEEEIKYLDTYLSLEKMKSNDRFSYAISVDEQIDKSATFIPGMILQPFVENSIRHGVAARENKDGMISIRISKNGKLLCHIEDNGIGREKAGEMKRLSADAGYESKGMDITRNRIDTINRIYGTSISVNIDDIKDNSGQTAGTSVDIEFPPDLE